MTNLSYANVCKCGTLIESVANPSMPLLMKDGQFLLTLSDGSEEVIQFCFFCGGYELGPATAQANKCECQALKKWSKNKIFPIKFDEELNEYHLVEEDGSTNLFYFCPVCGGMLAESRRGDFFVTPSQPAINDIYEKIKNIETVKELINILGIPDEKIDTNLEEAKEDGLLSRNSAKQTLIYNSIDESFSLIVLEDENKKIHFLYAGKPKK